jgi:putative Holliday junction resolvase
VHPGVRLALDIGTVRIGVARSDALGMLAVPLDAIPAGDGSWVAVSDLVEEWQAVAVFVGLPLHLSGAEGASSTMAREWAAGLAERIDVPVRLIDERLSSVQAQRALQAGGRSTRQSKSLIDSASAVMVLQSVLEAEARSGEAPGEPVEGGDGG